MTKLNEFLDQQEEVTKESFQVTDDSSANWALRKIKHFMDQQKENNALAEAEIEKIEAWATAENGHIQQNIDYFQSLLATYALKKRDEDPKFKSQKLPYGRIKFVKQQPKFNYNDDQLIESLKKAERTDLIKVKETPDKAAVKKLFVVHEDKLINPETGEVVEGVQIEHREDAFKVEVGE